MVQGCSKASVETIHQTPWINPSQCEIATGTLFWSLCFGGVTGVRNKTYD